MKTARPSKSSSKVKSNSNSTDTVKFEGNVARLNLAKPKLGQHSSEIQKFGTRVKLPIALNDDACMKSINALNQVLVDTITIRDLYKKHHWQVAGATFYQLHLLYDKHYEEQSNLVDMLAERVQMLGGITVAMAADVAERTNIERPPIGREEIPVQVSRLVEAHGVILKEARKAAREADANGDDGTNDILVSNIIRTNEMQVWFLAEHMAPEALTTAHESQAKNTNTKISRRA
jgi:starvation-inducible DNA-binding protein